MSGAAAAAQDDAADGAEDDSAEPDSRREGGAGAGLLGRRRRRGRRGRGRLRRRDGRRGRLGLRRPLDRQLEVERDLAQYERYVANPSKGSGHNRGLSIDLTLVDLKTGKEMEMGTGFDNFTDSAHHTFQKFPDTILENRKLLRKTMEASGFKALDTEWWHYSWPNDRNYEVMDIDFEELEK